MKNSGQSFLEELANSPPDTFEKSFSTASTRLELGRVFDRNDLTLLCEAAFRALLCNRAINGFEQGAVTGEEESQRSKLEWEFMSARDIFFASPGWQTLSGPEQQRVEQTFLKVVVAEDNLAN